MRLIDILKLFKRGRGGVKLCPVCETPSLKSSSPLNGWLTPQIYICTKCGYKGPIYLEVTPERGGSSKDR